jgi:cell division protein FtsB
MIQVNLLPPEYRRASGTPVARFVAIVTGVVLVVGASCAYAYTHFIQLAKVQEVKALREEEVRSKEAQRDRSLALEKEISEYQQRRKAIQTINRNRVLWSRKLDQFFDIVAGRGGNEPYEVWLEELEIPTQLATNRRAIPGVRGGPMDGGTFKFSGNMAMESKNEAPALNSAFYKALTGDPDTTRETNEFFADFLSISNPTIDILARVQNERLTPPIVGAFKYELRLKPPAVDAPGASPAAGGN